MVILIDILELRPLVKASNPLWKEKLAGRDRAATRARSRYFRQRSRVEKDRQDRRQDLCRNPLTARSLRTAVRQWPAPRWQRDAQARYPTPNTKGPGTLWDAPGMQRIKIPFGGLNAHQLEVLAELAEEYSTASRTSRRVRISSSTTSTSKTRRPSCGGWPRSGSRHAKPAAIRSGT